MNKITNANMFNWSKKKQKYETEEPRVRRKSSFSLTDTLRRSVIKSKFKASKEDLSNKSKEDISTKPPRPQPPIKNTQLPNEFAPLAKPENVDLSNEISQITLQVSKMTAEAQLSVENLKIDDEKVPHNKNLDVQIGNDEDELNKEKVQNSKTISQDSPIYANVNFETNQIMPHMTQMTVEDAQSNIEDLKNDDASSPHNKDLELQLENNSYELNNEEFEQSKRVCEDNPVYVNVNFETTQIKPQVSQRTVFETTLDNNQESSLENNEDNLNKEEVQAAKMISHDKPENINLISEMAQTTIEISQMTDNAQFNVEESNIDDQNVLHNDDQESPLENNAEKSNKDEIQISKRLSQVNLEDDISNETTQLSVQVSKTAAENAQTTIEELKINDENIIHMESNIDDENALHNNDQESQIEMNAEKSNEMKIQKSKRFSQINLEDVNINNETTQVTVQVSKTAAEDAQISIEELKINDENIIHNEELESPFEVNEDEAKNIELGKSRRISQISVEKEDIVFSKKEDIILNDDESDSIDGENGVNRRNSTIRRSIKLELTIIESQDTNTSRRNSRSSPEKESNRSCINGNQTEYPEELNPFAEDDDEDAVSLVNSEKQNLNNQHYNPFDSESDTEDTVKEANSSSLTAKNKTLEESKSKELPGGSLPPSPKAPARRRLPQTRSLQCLNEYSDPTKKTWQNKKSSSTLSKSNTQSDNQISSSTLEEKGEDFINSEDNLNMNGKPTQLPKSSVSIHTTSSGISSAGSNPFDDDDNDENEIEENSRLNKLRSEVARQRTRSSSPSLSLNESVLSVNSTPSKSLNPFEEDEEDDELESPSEFVMMRGATSRCSLAISSSNSSSFKRDTGIRGSLPPSRRPGAKKRLAPLPPGQLPPISPDKKGESYQKKGSISSSSPRKVPPPRPPPPRLQKIS